MKKVLYLIGWVWKFAQSFPLLTLATLFLGSIAFNSDVPKNFALAFALATAGSMLVWVGVKLTRPTELSNQSGTGCGAGAFVIQMFGCIITWVGTVLLINTVVLTCRIVV